MAKIKSSVTKALTRQLGKLLKKHGPEIAMGVATGIVADLLTNNAKKKAKKSMAGKAKKGTGKKASSKKADKKKSSAAKGKK